MRLHPGARWALGFMLAYLALTVTFSLFGSAYVSLLVPVIRWGIESTSSEIVVRSIAVEGESLKVVFAPLLEQGLRAAPDVTVKGGIQIFYTAPIVALAVLAVWPGKPRATRLLSMASALPLMALLPAIHYPSLMLAPKLGGDSPHSLFWFWYFFLNNGGPQVLALFFAWIAMSSCDRVLRWAAGETSSESTATLAVASTVGRQAAPGKHAVSGSSGRKRRGARS